METIRSTKVYGTTGLHYYGNKAIEADKTGNVAKVEAIFNQFTVDMKAIAGTSPGAQLALLAFDNWLLSGIGYGYAVAAGKDVVSNA